MITKLLLTLIMIMIIIIINRGATEQKTLVRTCTKLSSNKSRRQGGYTVEPASANGQNYPQ